MADRDMLVQVKIAGHIMWQPREMGGPGNKLLTEASGEAGVGER